MAYSGGADAIINNLKFSVVSSAMIIIINPLISHKGITIIAYLPDGNALTLESIIFGIVSAALLSCIITWFYSVNRVFTSDKIICLMGNIMPKTALLISMVLNFTDKFKMQFRSVKAVQANLGCSTKNGAPITRLKNNIKIFSILIQWMMESSIDTADSMKSRGYGLKKRTNYSVFRFFPRDIAITVFILICDSLIITSILSGKLYCKYYPSFSFGKQDAVTYTVFLTFSVLCMMPLLTDLREDKKWKYLRSKI